MDKPIRMSNSSFNQMKSCEQKYVYRKITKVETDPDVDTDLKHLRLGSCFHELLENCLHVLPETTSDDMYAAFESHSIDSDRDRGVLMAMWEKYWELHKASELTVIACEDEVGDDTIIGFIDAIMVDKNGFYYITDLKTAARFDGNLLARLKRDSQLNLYSHFRHQIEEKYNLDPDKFAGCLYRVTTKATIVKKASETITEFKRRVKPKIESYSIFIPAEHLAPEETYKEVMAAQAKAMQFRDEGLEPKRDYSNCFQYFRPCEYFSSCYGYLNSEADKSFNIEATWNVKPMLQEEEDIL